MRWQFNGSCKYKDPKDGLYKCEYRHEDEQKGIFDRKGKDGKKICMHFAKLGSSSGRAGIRGALWHTRTSQRLTRPNGAKG